MYAFGMIRKIRTKHVHDSIIFQKHRIVVFERLMAKGLNKSIFQLFSFTDQTPFGKCNVFLVESGGESTINNLAGDEEENERRLIKIILFR